MTRTGPRSAHTPPRGTALPAGPFAARLASLLAPLDPSNRRWLFVPYDQLSDRIGPLASTPPRELGLILVECPEKAARRPYHQQKLAYVLANLRHFALEQAARGVYVRHLVGQSYRAALDTLRARAPELFPLTVMEPAERELRHELAPLTAPDQTTGRAPLTIIPHEGWLTTPDDFARSQERPPWKMEPFYQLVRRRTGILMDGEHPIGGAFNFDAHNRRPWRPERGDPPAPTPRVFTPDAVTSEVGDLIRAHFAHHPGRLDLTTLPATHADARATWDFARRHCLPHFGPFEDAMSTRSSTLFHTRVSPLLNLHRLLPRDLVADCERLPIDLPSKEGFIRQILGWREYVRHVHAATDGFRRSPAPPAPTLESPGDGGWSTWSGAPWPSPGDATPGGAAPSALDAHAPVPPAFWGARSGLACLDTVVAEVWQTGYSHHITRLMVLSNIATTLGISPRALTDWFWVAYVDAYDWVVEPNVLGMGTYGVGGLMTTKPYVSGAAYIDRMSDYCSTCAFNPKKDCPITSLYWDFLARHAAGLRQNPRTSGAIAGLARRSEDQRAADHAVAAVTAERLARGLPVTPSDVALARRSP